MAITTPYRRYLVQAAFAFLGVSIFAGIDNFLIDPYGMFGTPRVKGFNAIKPAAPDRIRYTKPYYADRARARTLIAGNSRPEMGLDPTSPCWNSDEQPVFNTGVPGIGFSDQIAFVEHAVTNERVKTVFLALDLSDFFVNPEDNPNYASWPGPITENNFNLRTRVDGSTNPHYSIRRLKDWLTGLFSLKTLSDSLATIIQQSGKNQATRRPDGFNPASDYHPIIRSEGQSVLFAQKNREVVQNFSRPGRGIYQGSTAWSWPFETLDRFLARAKGRGMDVILFINPYHADFLTTIAITSRWTLLDQWKRTLVSIADRHEISLWDFNAFDERTEEPPPIPSDRKKELRWFWEPAHYRREYGEQMLASMLGRDCVPKLAGETQTVYRLTPANVEGHLASLRRDLQTYMTNHPETVARIETAGEMRKE
jgi:hypothetical protein